MRRCSQVATMLAAGCTALALTCTLGLALAFSGLLLMDADRFKAGTLEQDGWPCCHAFVATDGSGRVFWNVDYLHKDMLTADSGKAVDPKGCKWRAVVNGACENLSGGPHVNSDACQSKSQMMLNHKYNLITSDGLIAYDLRHQCDVQCCDVSKTLWVSGRSSTNGTC